MDPNTIVITLSANLTFSGGLYHLIGRKLPPRSGVGLWSAAAVTFGVAYFARAMAGLWSGSPLFLAFDLAMIGSGLLFLGGLRQFLGQRAGGRQHLAALLLVYAGALAAVLSIWGQQGRYALLNLTLGTIWASLAIASAANIGKTQEPALRTPLALNAALIGTLAGLTLLRGATVAREGVGTMFGTVQSSIYYGYASLAVVLLALTLLWMVFLRLHGQLADLAKRDALTGLLNRNGLKEAMASHFAARDAVPVTLLQVDIDHFKRINDRFGHATGDAVLSKVACTLARHVRGSDVVARVGGEEFVVSCASAEPGAAALLAERLRAAVEGLRMRSEDGKPAVLCTISVGLSTPFVRLDRWEASWREADHALYAAKSAGRNRATAFADQPALANN
jgi:diguanylate cyclase (GGDEF)-like protein